MTRHDSSFRTASQSTAGEILVQGSAVSYLLQFPLTACRTLASEPLVPVAVLTAELPQLPIAHMYSA